MIESAHNPPFRLPPVASLALRPLPLLPLQLLLQGLVSKIARRHPQLHERLQTFEGRCVGVDPSDLPFTILLEPRRNAIALRVVRQLDREPPAARIRGPLLALMGLVNGSYDADALFFSRDITLEGDIEAALALRNAIDDAEIDLAGEAAAYIGFLAPPLRHAVRLAMAGCAAVLSRTQGIAR